MKYLLVLFALLTALACDDGPGPADQPDSGQTATDGGSSGVDAYVVQSPVSGSLSVQFQTGQPSGAAGGVRGRGVYIWIEDRQGNYVDTVQQYFGREQPGACPPDDLHYTCTGYRYYDDPCWDWHTITEETALIQPDPNNPPDPVTGTLVLDGVTQASVLPVPGGLPESAGTVTSHAWDCRDKNGNPIEQGAYTVQMEITWERADGLGHTRPCETYPGEFPCSFRYTATIELGVSDSSAAFDTSDWMASSSSITFTAQ